MTTFIKTKFKISDDHNIDKYRLAANITEYHIISKLISINKKLDFCGPESHLGKSTISNLEFPSNFQVKENLIKSVHKQGNFEFGLLWSRESFGVKYNAGFGIPIKFPSQ